MSAPSLPLPRGPRLELPSVSGEELRTLVAALPRKDKSLDHQGDLYFVSSREWIRVKCNCGFVSQTMYRPEFPMGLDVRAWDEYRQHVA